MTEATKKKHVAKELNDYYYIPDDNQFIVQVIRGCGNNLHEVQNSNGEQFLVSMPTKFRRSFWIKRNDFLIVTPIEEGNKVRAEIHSILFKDHIRYLKEQNKWPKEFDDNNKSECQTTGGSLDSDLNDNNHADNLNDDDKSDDDDDDLLIPNMNRMNFANNDQDDDEDEDEEDNSDEESEEDEENQIKNQNVL